MAKEQEQFNPWLVAFYSGLASMCGDMLMYPIDTIATRIKANTEHFLSFRQGYDLIVKNEGPRYLFRGFSTTFMGSFVPFSTYFLIYEWLNHYAVKSTKKDDGSKSKLNLLIPLVTAPIAEIASVLTYIPIDTVRTRMQMNTPEYNYKGVTQAILEIQKNEGIIRLFQASHLYMVQVVIYTTFQMWFYELIRYKLLVDREKKDLKIHESVLATIGSTSVATLIVNPLDLIITRFQLVDSRKAQLSGRRILKELLVNEGKLALMKGIGARLINQCVFSAFYLPVYDHCKAKYGITLAD
ncbi:hypothetical protein pb186bvf_018766 [Paramecium bursaria]